MKTGSFNKIAVCITGGVLLFCAGFYCRDAMTRDVIVVEPERTAAVLAVSTISAESSATVSPELSVQEAPERIAEDGAVESEEASKPADDGLVDLNSASQTELETLPGIGPVLARRIIEYREQNGDFAVVEEVLNVSGIGEKKYDAIKDLVKVEE